MGANNSKSSGKAAAEKANSPGETASAQKTSQFEALPDDVAKQVFTALSINEKAALARTSKRSYGLFSQHIHTAKLLMLVVHGEQEPAAHMLAGKAALLLERADVTDYSGRTFKHITAYEYAYWAKDTHMCRMLEAHMDAKTKAAMLEKVTAIDTVGLMYEQGGRVVEHSKHFDLMLAPLVEGGQPIKGPLLQALQDYVDGYDAWDAAQNYDAMRAAWRVVGLAQRDLPVHVINEYCRPDRSFHPLPAFNEDQLPRILTYYNFSTGGIVPLFPLVVDSLRAVLGVDLAISRAGCVVGEGSALVSRLGGAGARAAGLDLAAVSRLDEVRTRDLTQSRKNLRLIEPELGGGLVL